MYNYKRMKITSTSGITELYIMKVAVYCFLGIKSYKVLKFHGNIFSYFEINISIF